MAIKIAIVGDYGSGKSSSILPIGNHKGLPSTETFIISALNKDLPAPKAMKMYSEANKNFARPTSLEQAALWIGGNDTERRNAAGIVTRPKCEGLTQKRKDIKYIVIDDFVYLSTKPLLDNITATGYDKYNKMADDNIFFMQQLDKLSDDIYVFCMFHEERIGDKENLKMKVKTASPLTDKLLNLEGLFTYVFYTDPGFNEDTKGVEYCFLTNTAYNRLGILTPAKTPYGCFEELRIPNDLGYVVEKIKAYRA